MKNQTSKVELPTCFFGKRPELSLEKSGTMFFKARSQIFFGISKKKIIHHNSYPQNDHWKIFFSKKNLSKKFANKIAKKKLWKKKLKINFFLPKIFFNGHFEGNDYGE